MPSSIKKFKDKEKARLYRNRQRKNNYKTTQTGERKSWTQGEEDLLFCSGYSDRELAQILDCSVQAIQIKRCRVIKKLKEVQDDKD